MENIPPNTYTLEGKTLGKGSFGTVYLGRFYGDPSKESTKVALKEIPESIKNDPSIIESLSKEVLISFDINKSECSKNVVSIKDIADINNNKYLVYEYCDGGDLRRYLKVCKKFNEKMVQCIISQIIQGLIQLHSQKIIHHDIKPENILIEFPKSNDNNENIFDKLQSSTFKVSDFGLSKYKDNNYKIEVSGSPFYMDVCLFSKNKNIDIIENEKVDIWALGVLAYELFFGKLPFVPKVISFRNFIDTLKKGIYYIDLKKCGKISKQFLSFLNMCLQRNQNIRPLAEELQFCEFITLDSSKFKYLDIDNYKEAKFPNKKYTDGEEGIIRMNIDDNRMVNANFDDIN